MKRKMKRLRRSICMVLSLAMILGLVPIAGQPVQKAKAATSKTLNINWKNIKAVGNQPKDSDTCLCYSLAYCRTLLDGKVHRYYEYNKWGKRQNNSEAVASKANYTDSAGSVDKLKSQIFNSINKGRPVVVYVNNGKGQHWVAVVGYQNVSSASSITEANLLMIDPGTSKGISKSKLQTMKSMGYTFRGATYRCKYTNSGSVASTTTAQVAPLGISTRSAYLITNTTASMGSNMSRTVTSNDWGYYIRQGNGAWSRHREGYKPSTAKNFYCAISNTYKMTAGTTYTIKGWVKVDGKEYVGNESTFKTTSTLPAKATLTAGAGGTDLGKGASPIVNWTTPYEAQTYILKLYKEEELVQEKTDVQGNTFAFDAITEPGTYTAKITSCNEAGKSGESDGISFKIHDDVSVTYKDHDGAILKQQTVPYGGEATAPESPIRKGYTFSKWKAAYNDSENAVDTRKLVENVTFTADYTINKYKVIYIDSNTNKQLKSEQVEYQSQGNPPDYTVEEGYIKVGTGWDKDFSSVTEDMTLYTVTSWYNENLPVKIMNSTEYPTTVVRSKDEDDETATAGYEAKVSLRNWDAKATRGRIVVALKTKNGKLITTTESSAFYMKKSEIKKEVEIFVPSEKAATNAEIYVVPQYSDAIPISETTKVEIDQSNEFSSWSTEQPPENATTTENRKEYSYQEKSTQTSYEATLNGWTQDGSSWIPSGSGTIDYLPSVPSGLYRSSSFYKDYAKQPVTPSETSTNKTTVSTTDRGWIYYHWCRGTYSNGPINRCTSSTWTSTFRSFAAFFSTVNKTKAVDGSYNYPNASVCKDSYWFYKTQLKRCSYTNYRKLFNYYQWSDWSDWSTNEAVAEEGKKNVKERTVYRYKANQMGEEDDSGKEYERSGKVSTTLAGQHATLFVYKVDSASDYTNEYVGHTTIETDGSYQFKFKLREEPTEKSGDYTVAFGVEGAKTVSYLEPIKAPVKTYTVKYHKVDGSVISTQTVTAGAMATIPTGSAIGVPEGYTFTNWSASNTYISADMDIYPQYKVKEYLVTFVDWNARSVVQKEFEHGAELVPPIVEQSADESMEITWDKVDEGVTKVTGNMVVCTVSKKKVFSIPIYNYDGTLIETQTVEYGKKVNLPDMTKDGYIFLGWANEPDGEEVTDLTVDATMSLYPLYMYEDTVEDPVASVEDGEYTEAQTVSLTCETAGAKIYYTTDGSEPSADNGTLYTTPISVDKEMELQVIAVSSLKNDSHIQKYYYAINKTDAYSEWMEYSEVPDYVKQDKDAYELVQNVSTGKYRYKFIKYHIVTIDGGMGQYCMLVKDNAKISESDLNKKETENFIGLYKDSEYSDQWNLGQDVVTSTCTLYAKYETKKFTVKFKDTDGSTLSTQDVCYSEEAEAPAAESKAGKVFIGWNTDDYICVTEDVTISAQYVATEDYAKVELDKSSLNLFNDTTATLTANVYSNKDGSIDKSVTWSTADDGVADVTEEGTVIAVSPGATTITAKVKETGETADCNVRVVDQSFGTELQNQTGFHFSQTGTIQVKKSDEKVNLSATGGESTGSVTYKVVAGEECISIDEKTGVATITQAGIAVVNATKAGDTCYKDAFAIAVLNIIDDSTPTPPPTPTGSAIASPTPSALPTPTPTPVVLPTPTPVVTPTPTPVVLPTPTPVVTPTPTPVVIPTPTPTPVVTPTPTVKPTENPLPLPTVVPLPTAVPTTVPTIVPTITPDKKDKAATVSAPGKTKIIKAKNTKKAKMAITIKKLSSVKGYQLAYATNRKFKKAQVVFFTSNKVVIKDLAKKKYYVRARAYRLSEGKKVFGKWSGVKKVRIKK